MKFASALLDYFKKGNNGRPTGVADIKPFILDKENRDNYVAELESYGYTIDPI